ncbi:mitochondrial ribosome-associated GTPase 1 [Pelodiscus sinensis]|uniref:mitochondrial ribosome-associated GTPase 1 n=1 Tax=Pelodiscus sinensis TaxID=13735 RepID=UPI003F6AFEA0
MAGGGAGDAPWPALLLGDGGSRGRGAAAPRVTLWLLPAAPAQPSAQGAGPVCARNRKPGGGSCGRRAPAGAVPGRAGSGAMRLAAGALRAAWRQSFDFGGRSVAAWFPGHMAKGLRQMKETLRKVDCIVEVHDARIPFSGRNPAFHEALGIRPHLLVLNKMDLADLTHKARILERLEQEGLRNVLFTNCVKDENVQKVVPLITDLVSHSQRYQRAENIEYCILVIGVPNVGKSSLINSMRRLHLRKGKASRVGGEPGITTAVLTRIQVSERPLMYLLDTPGVLAPRIESVEAGMKLALCGAIRDHLVGEDVMADYLLYTLNKQQLFCYVERYGLGAPSDDIESVLKQVALKLGKTHKVKVLTGTGDVNVIAPDYPAAAYEFLRTFRKGELGQVLLD